MQAAVLESFGGPETLVPQMVPDPITAPGWVTVELEASALNWHDVLVRRGQYGSPLPHIIGSDGAGRRRDTGDPVLILPSLWWGDDERAPGSEWEILGDRIPGTYAELVRVPEGHVAPIPRGLSFEQAAALPLVGLTAYRALFSRGRLQAGEHLLLLGAGGGLATMATLLATAAGATVIVTSSSEGKIARSQALGARAGVLYLDEAWPAAARELTPQGRGFDLVLDAAGATWQSSIETLRPGGRVVVVGATAGTEATLAVRPFYFGQYDLLGSTMGSPRDFRGLLGLLEQHPGLAPPIHETFPLDRAADAHRALEAGGQSGKLVLAIR